MGMFQKLDGESVILVCPGGIYKQADLYARDALLYAKIGGGFIKLFYDKSTSSSRHRIDTLSWDNGSLWRTGTGVITTEPHDPGALLLRIPELAALGVSLRGRLVNVTDNTKSPIPLRKKAATRSSVKKKAA